jgi:hypothetical protein
MSDESKPEVKDDGVNREGLNYRAGWVEALRALAQRINVEAVRAKKNQIPGLELASQISKEMFEAMLDKMRGGGSGGG